jgi:hypothetical protein
MSALLGEFSCTAQFRFDRLAELQRVERETCSGKTEMGTAVHECIARALRNETLRESILAGRPATGATTVRAVLAQEFELVTAGREVRWYGKSDHTDALDEGTAMILGLFSDMHRHVSAVELVEAGFICQLGDLWLEGHTDLIYRPRANPDALAFTDWKTGATKPDQISLDHGWESGFYAQALACGTFLPTTVLDAWRQASAEGRAHDVPLDPADVEALASAHNERAAMHIALRAIACNRQRDPDVLIPGIVRFDRFPDVIQLTHLRDYIPYEKKGTKSVTRPEDLAHWSRVLGRPVVADEKITYEKGQWRGGAWLDVKRREGDVPRLERMLRAVVGWVRFGRFVESVGEKCKRCSYQGPCLTSGYELTGDDAKQLKDALRGLDLAGVADLSVDD